MLLSFLNAGTTSPDLYMGERSDANSYEDLDFTVALAPLSSNRWLHSQLSTAAWCLHEAAGLKMDAMPLSGMAAIKALHILLPQAFHRRCFCL